MHSGQDDAGQHGKSRHPPAENPSAFATPLAHGRRLMSRSRVSRCTSSRHASRLLPSEPNCQPARLPGKHHPGQQLLAVTTRAFMCTRPRQLRPIDTGWSGWLTPAMTDVISPQPFASNSFSGLFLQFPAPFAIDLITKPNLCRRGCVSTRCGTIRRRPPADSTPPPTELEIL